MRKLSFLLVILLLSAMQVLAQRTITGNVTSADDGNGIPGVTVLVKGTSQGVLTDLDGKYSINVPKDATALQFSFIGMTTQEIALTAANVLDVVMQSEAQNLEGVVVTALGITRDKKSLGYSTQELSGEEINNAKRTNFVDNLSGKLAGVQVKSNGNMGGSTNVVIRGSSSMTGNNQALFVIDGVPVNNDNTNNAGQISGRSGYDYGNAASDIDPNDIESMSVLKGAAATALYGSRAANGVILITTKKGKKAEAGKKNLGVSINSSITTGFVDKSTFPKYQQNYGAGYGTYYYGDPPYGGFESVWDVNGDGTIDLTVPTYEDASYGQKFDPSILVYQWDSYDPASPNYQKATPWKVADNGPITLLDNSLNLTNSVEVAGGGDASTFRLGYSNVSEIGIMPNQEKRYDPQWIIRHS
jgi:TonB-dependent SusC/RagA subfamily outer membrane receptor